MQLHPNSFGVSTHPTSTGLGIGSAFFSSGTAAAAATPASGTSVFNQPTTNTQHRFKFPLPPRTSITNVPYAFHSSQSSTIRNLAVPTLTQTTSTTTTTTTSTTSHPPFHSHTSSLHHDIGKSIVEHRALQHATPIQALLSTFRYATESFIPNVPFNSFTTGTNSTPSRSPNHSRHHAANVAGRRTTTTNLSSYPFQRPLFTMTRTNNSHSNSTSSNSTGHQRQTPSTNQPSSAIFNENERARVLKRSYDVMENSQIVEDHHHKQQKMIEDEIDELERLTNSMTIASIQAESKPPATSLTSFKPSKPRRPLLPDHPDVNVDNLHLQSLSIRDQFVEANIDLKIRQEKAAPAWLVQKLLDELMAEVEDELVKESVADGKKLCRLTNAEIQQSVELMQSPPKKLIVDKFNIEIFGADLAKLSNLNWLSDQTINFYMEMLSDRQKRNQANPRVLPSQKRRIHYFNTFFYKKLSTDGSSYVYKSVSRWMKAAKVNVLELDKIIIPIHVHGNHWCLAIINLREKQFEYFDSLGGRNLTCLQHLRSYLSDELKANYPNEAPRFQLETWSMVHHTDLPQQNNGSDCGVFTCKFADYASEERPINFTCKDMPYFRRRIALEIANQQIL